MQEAKVSSRNRNIDVARNKEERGAENSAFCDYFVVS